MCRPWGITLYLHIKEMSEELLSERHVLHRRLLPTRLSPSLHGALASAAHTSVMYVSFSDTPNTSVYQGLKPLTPFEVCKTLPLP